MAIGHSHMLACVTKTWHKGTIPLSTLPLEFNTRATNVVYVRVLSTQSYLVQCKNYSVSTPLHTEGVQESDQSMFHVADQSTRSAKSVAITNNRPK